MIIDAHCHVSSVWYEPVETLLHEMDRCHVDKAVLVQLLGQYDNQYLMECCRRYPDRFACVIGVGEQEGDAYDELKKLSDIGGGGVRCRPDMGQNQKDPYFFWRLAEELGLVVSCVGSTSGFLSDYFLGLLKEINDLPIILEHLGGIARPDMVEEHKEEILKLSRFSNVFLKVPGLGQLAPRPMGFEGENAPIDRDKAGQWLKKTLDSFGSERLMWGSDFPPVAAREGYENSLKWVEGVFEGGEKKDIENIFGQTAGELFDFL